MKSAVKKAGGKQARSTAAVDFAWNIPVLRGLPQVTRQREDGSTQTVTVVPSDTPLQGTVTLQSSLGRPVQYEALAVELQGVIELNDDSGVRIPFFSVARILKGAGVLMSPEVYGFDFTGNPLPCESINISTAAFCIKYYLTCRVTLKNGAPLEGNYEFACIKYLPRPDEVHPVRTEVGVEDALHIEFEFNNSFLDFTQDLLVGRVHFVLAAKKIEEMTLYIRRRELFRSAKDATEWEASNWKEVYAYDLMEGAPTREEVIPIRCYLANMSLSPSFSTELAKIEYVAVLALTDSEGKTYFKSTDLTLYRGRPQQ